MRARRLALTNDGNAVLTSRRRLAGASGVRPRMRQASDQDRRRARPERRSRRLGGEGGLVKSELDRRECRRWWARFADEGRCGRRSAKRRAMHHAADVAALPRRTRGRRRIAGKRSGRFIEADGAGEKARTATAERDANSEALQNKQIGDEQGDCRRSTLPCSDFAATAHSRSKLFTDSVKVNGVARRVAITGSRAGLPAARLPGPSAPRWR
jgi:hypothetical protein